MLDEDTPAWEHTVTAGLNIINLCCLTIPLALFPPPPCIQSPVINAIHRGRRVSHIETITPPNYNESVIQISLTSPTPRVNIQLLAQATTQGQDRSTK